MVVSVHDWAVGGCKGLDHSVMFLGFKSHLNADSFGN